MAFWLHIIKYKQINLSSRWSFNLKCQCIICPTGLHIISYSYNSWWSTTQKVPSSLITESNKKRSIYLRFLEEEKKWIVYTYIHNTKLQQLRYSKEQDVLTSHKEGALQINIGSAANNIILAWHEKEWIVKLTSVVRPPMWRTLRSIINTRGFAPTKGWNTNPAE